MMIGSIERRIIAQHHSDEASKRLRSIPGIGIVGATAIAATVTDPKVFRSGRDFAAWIGIVPRQEFDRWQTETGADLETRRPISETHSGGRSPCGVEAGTPPTGEVSVGHTASRTQTVQGRGGGSRQQDGARRLGVVGQGRQLSSACACGSGVRSLPTAELVCVCAHMDCRGDDDVDAKRSRPSIGKTREGPRDT